MGRIVLYTNLLCAKSAAIRRLIEQHGVKPTEVPLTGQSFAEVLPRVTGRKSLPLLALNRKEYLTADELLDLEEKGSLEKRLKDAVEDASDTRTTGPEDDIRDLTFDDKYEEEKLDDVYYKLRDPSDGVKLRVPTIKKDKYFKAVDLVSWAAKSISMSDAEAVKLGQQLKDKGYITKRHEENLKTSTSPFIGDSTSWRFTEDVEPTCLNVRRAVEKNADPGSPVHFSGDIFFHNRLLVILQKYGSDYNSLTRVASFRKFLAMTTLLQVVSLNGLGDSELLCFFLNVYNTLLLHAALAGGSKKVIMSRSYCISGMRFTLLDIEISILRGNRKPVGDGKRLEKNDDRLSVTPTWSDPRALFIVYPVGTNTCPIQVFTTDTLEEALFRAAEIACDEIELDVDKKIVSLPPLFKDYGIDFGKGKPELLQWVDKYLTEERSVQMGLIIRNPPAEITLQYHSYTWESMSRFVFQVGEVNASRGNIEEVEDDDPPPTMAASAPATMISTKEKDAAKRAEEQNARIMRGSSQPVSGSPKPVSRQASDSAAALAQSFSELSTAAMNAPGRARFYWEVDMEEVEMGIKIGQGAFGVVYKAEWAGTEVAVKQLLGDDFTDQQLSEFLKEINIMSQLRHPNIVLFVGACLNPPNVFYLTEFLHRGSLHACLLKEVPLDWRLRVHMALDGAKGMTYLHMRNMLHRDIKSLNFLVDLNYVVKVADFGLSKVLQDNTRAMMNTRVGTLNWLAPETLADHGVYTNKSDVFSYGMVLYEILTHRAPFEGKTPLQVIRALDAGDRPEIPADSDPIFVALVKDAWHQEPNRRPPFADILRRLRSQLQSLDAVAMAAGGMSRLSGNLAVPKDPPRKLSNA